jgi:hypothetical protein
MAAMRASPFRSNGSNTRMKRDPAPAVDFLAPALGRPAEPRGHRRNRFAHAHFLAVDERQHRNRHRPRGNRCRNARDKRAGSRRGRRVGGSARLKIADDEGAHPDSGSEESGGNQPLENRRQLQPRTDTKRVHTGLLAG